jgi:hypothetical protein
MRFFWQLVPYSEILIIVVAGDWNICRVWNPVAGGLASPAHCCAMRPLLQVQVSRVCNIWCLFLLAIFFLLIAASCVPLLQEVSIVCNTWCLFLVAGHTLFVYCSSMCPLLQVQVS